jgi:kynurenine formamidase
VSAAGPRLLDLTRRLDAALPIYADGAYRDPPFEVAEWSSIELHGFRVSAVRMGTQTGTHLDAPAHFDPRGACAEAFPLADAVGPYFLLDLPAVAGLDDVLGLAAGYREAPFLFVRTPDLGAARIERDALAALCALPSPIWVLAGELEVVGAPPHEVHYALAHAGKFLVEDLEPAAAAAVTAGGELIVLPLALAGTSGAPCRVIARLPR